MTFWIDWLSLLFSYGFYCGDGMCFVYNTCTSVCMYMYIYRYIEPLVRL